MTGVADEINRGETVRMPSCVIHITSICIINLVSFSIYIWKRGHGSSAISTLFVTALVAVISIFPLYVSHSL